MPDHIEWFSPDGLRAIASLIGSIAWPLLVLFVILLFHRQLKELMPRLTEVELPGFKAKVERELDQSAQAAEKAEGLSKAPTPGERQRAIQVEKLTSDANLSFVRRQVEELASEYERVRGSMPASDARTRAMEVVVSKMRTIGRAAYPLRYELSVSPSPGRRLQAIASLQIMPDFDDLLDWLVDRIDTERPFVAYHALVALNAAVTDDRAASHLDVLQRVADKLREKSTSLAIDTDQRHLAATFVDRVKALASPSVH